MQELHSGGREAGMTEAWRDNALVAAANPLLNAIPQIRHSVSHADPAGLRQRLIEEIQRFEVRSQ
ncbi:DotU family type IV/VI secretion system protein, partial [Pseudomonas azotoformans]